MSNTQPARLEPLSKAYTWIAGLMMPLCIYGFFTIRGSAIWKPAKESEQITIAYFGIVITIFAACVLIMINIIYRKRAIIRNRTLRIPANTMFETEKERDRLISLTTMIVVYLMIAFTSVACIIRYADSKIYEWDAKAPLAPGFVSSRLEAMRLGCSDPPCYAIHQRMDSPGKREGVGEYVLFLNDGVLIVLSILLIFLLARFAMLLKRRRSRPM